MRVTMLVLCSTTFAACSARPTTPAFPAAIELPETVSIVDGGSGAPVALNAFLNRLAASDIVLLGEVHDNAIQHGVRGQIISALRARRPAIVFEQFAASDGPIRPPADGENLEAWLDRSGFDRDAWRWPVHRPVVQAALSHGRGIRGSGISRESLRSVVRDGESAAPTHLRAVLDRAPMDSAAQAALDRELVEGHCGQLPSNMVAGMRAAQTVRDASMALALARAAADGPALLIAGNGHVRRDIAVPRLLRVTAPEKRVIAVGFLERTADGGEPGAAARAVYDVVVVTPRRDRPDPCAGLRRP